jgi:hypothetical protein
LACPPEPARCAVRVRVGVEPIPRRREASDRGRPLPVASERAPHGRRISLPPDSSPSASYRVLLVRPSVGIDHRCPLPRTEVRFGPTLPRARHVPPSRFLTALTGCSTEDRPGLLHPGTDHGVHRVGAAGFATCRAFPRCQALQSFPLRISGVSRRRETLPPWCSPTNVWPYAPSRFHSDTESVASTPRFRGASPVALLGFPVLEPRPP